MSIDATKIGSLQPLQRSGKDSNSNKGLQDLGFDKTLQELVPKAKTAETGSAKVALRFSNHAVERMRQRGVSFSAEQMHKLGEAVDKASQKGAKETLVITDDSALVVSVKNNTVVTVMDKNSLKENVFTNIDSTVVI